MGIGATARAVPERRNKDIIAAEIPFQARAFQKDVMARDKLRKERCTLSEPIIP
jgi:hypothetical protein